MKSGPRTKILILDSGAGLLNPVIQSLQSAPGIEIHVLTREPGCPARYSRFVRSLAPWPRSAARAQDLKAVIQVLEQTRAKVLLPLDEPALELVASARESLLGLASLPLMPEPETLDLAGDKWRLSRFMERKGIPQPRTLLLETGKEDLSSFPFPALIKKTKGSGGQGIRLFQTREELLEFLEDQGREVRGVILQKYLSGGEVDCSLLAQEGRLLAYTIQRPLLPKNSYDFARAIEFVHDPEALNLSARLMAELEYSGVAHVDLIRDQRSGRLKVLEINPRYWGSLVGSVRAGVNFPGLALRQALGLELPKPGFRETRFATAREALRLLCRRLGRRGAAGVPLGQTNLGFLLSDPLPVVAGFIRGFRAG